MYNFVKSSKIKKILRNWLEKFKNTKRNIFEKNNFDVNF